MFGWEYFSFLGKVFQTGRGRKEDGKNFARDLSEMTVFFVGETPYFLIHTIYRHFSKRHALPPNIISRSHKYACNADFRHTEKVTKENGRLTI